MQLTISENMEIKGRSFLIIGINFYPEPTGIGKYTGEMAFYIHQRGIATDVITTPPYYPDWKIGEGYVNSYFKQVLLGVNIRRCPLYLPMKVSGKKRMLQDLSFFLSALPVVLKRSFFDKSYDFVFVASPSFLTGFLGLIMKTFSRKTKLIYHIQDLQIDAAEELGMIKSKTLLKYLKKAEQIILKKSTFITTISAGMKKRVLLKGVASDKLFLFPNWVDTKNFHPKAPEDSVLRSLGIPLDKKICLYSGAVGEKQGLEVLLPIAKEALYARSDIHFVISGNGPYIKKLRKEALLMSLTNLSFISLQPISIFNELLNKAFLHLILQKDQAADLLLPSKLTNILAVGGISIVTSAKGSTLYNIIAENDMGILVSPNDPNELADAILSQSLDSKVVAKMKKNAIVYAQTYLEKKSIIDQFLREVMIR